MKKIHLISLLICVLTKGFSQESDSLLERKTIFYSTYYHKGKKFQDTADYKVTVDKADLKKLAKGEKLDLTIDAEQENKSLNSIPENMTFYVNNVLTIKHNLLKYIPYYEVVHVRKGKHKGTVLPQSGNLRKNEKIMTGVYETNPKTIIYQGHTIIPKDFFLINEKTFQSQRYSCSIDAPIWDYLYSQSSTISSKPVYVIDGRIQKDGFDCGDTPENEIKTIEIFDAEDGKRYFGRKGSNGVVAIATKKFTGDLLPKFRNIRIIGETEYEMGRWKKTSDTTVEDINAYWNYRKATFSQNGPVYMIGGNEENSQTNRKTIEMTRVLGIEIKRDNRRIIIDKNKINMDTIPTYLEKLEMVSEDFIQQDTILIKLGIRPEIVSINTQIDGVYYNLLTMRNGGKIPTKNSSRTPIYIVDNQEVTAEKLKEFKSKELEFVESLEGCDAISKYGKRAEFGVVIYRKRG